MPCCRHLPHNVHRNANAHVIRSSPIPFPLSSTFQPLIDPPANGNKENETLMHTMEGDSTPTNPTFTTAATTPLRPRLTIFELPPLQDSLTQHLTRHDLAQCLQVSHLWHHLFLPYFWGAPHITIPLKSDPDFTRVLLQNREYIRAIITTGNIKSLLLQGDLYESQLKDSSSSSSSSLTSSPVSSSADLTLLTSTPLTSSSPSRQQSHRPPIQKHLLQRPPLTPLTWAFFPRLTRFHWHTSERCLSGNGLRIPLLFLWDQPHLKDVRLEFSSLRQFEIKELTRMLKGEINKVDRAGQVVSLRPRLKNVWIEIRETWGVPQPFVLWKSCLGLERLWYRVHEGRYGSFYLSDSEQEGEEDGEEEDGEVDEEEEDDDDQREEMDAGEQGDKEESRNELRAKQEEDWMNNRNDHHDHRKPYANNTKKILQTTLIDLNFYTRDPRMEALNLIPLLQHSPHLQRLSLTILNCKTLRAVPRILRLYCPKVRHLSLGIRPMSDSGVARILDALAVGTFANVSTRATTTQLPLAQGLISFRATHMMPMPRTLFLKSLIQGHGATLERLDLIKMTRWDSFSFLKVMRSCPRLRVFKASVDFETRRVESTGTGVEEEQETVDFENLFSRDWVCEKTLQHLELDLFRSSRTEEQEGPYRPGDGSASDLYIRYLFHQVGRIKSLERLCLGGWMMLLRLDCGIGALQDLKSLRVLDVRNHTFVKLETRECEWMIQEWIGLEKIVGLIGKPGKEAKECLTRLKPGLEFWEANWIGNGGRDGKDGWWKW